MRRRRRTSPRRRGPSQPRRKRRSAKPKAPPAAPRKPAASERLIPIGRRYERSALGDPVTLATDLLPRHIAVLAGPGSGKTVLLRRIVEEAALLGIPSIVVDPNNDLSRLGDAWPTRPESWSEEDAAKAETYRACADVVIWTPGMTSGNPISLNLLPDFAAIDDADEREKAIGMAWATLIPFLPGGGERRIERKVSSPMPFAVASPSAKSARRPREFPPASSILATVRAAPRLARGREGARRTHDARRCGLRDRQIPGVWPA
jgi:DNA helicase HerA-like ATPase